MVVEAELRAHLEPFGIDSNSLSVERRHKQWCNMQVVVEQVAHGAECDDDDGGTCAAKGEACGSSENAVHGPYEASPYLKKDPKITL